MPFSFAILRQISDTVPLDICSSPDANRPLINQYLSRIKGGYTHNSTE